jgi:hypothetical protein
MNNTLSLSVPTRQDNKKSGPLCYEGIGSNKTDKNCGAFIEEGLVFILENPGIDPGASRMLSERSTI